MENFSKAAQGFVRGKGLTVDDIEFVKLRGKNTFTTKHEAGKPAKEVWLAFQNCLLH